MADESELAKAVRTSRALLAVAELRAAMARYGITEADLGPEGLAKLASAPKVVARD